jgi:hypothetical protein
MCTQHSHHIHSPTPFPHFFPSPTGTTLPTPLQGVFWGICILFFKMAEWVHIPDSSILEACVSQSIVICLLTVYIFKCEALSHCDFDLHSFIIKILLFLHATFDCSYLFFWKCQFTSLVHF